MTAGPARDDGRSAPICFRWKSRGLIEQVGSQETLPIIEARLHRKARNLVSARDRGNLLIVAAMQEEVVNLTELRVRMERWLDEYDPAAYSSAGNLMS